MLLFLLFYHLFDNKYDQRIRLHFHQNNKTVNLKIQGDDKIKII